MESINFFLSPEVHLPTKMCSFLPTKKGRYSHFFSVVYSEIKYFFLLSITVHSVATLQPSLSFFLVNQTEGKSTFTSFIGWNVVSQGFLLGE